MKQDTKEAEKLTELLKKADGHPVMKQILAEEAAAVLAKRAELSIENNNFDTAIRNHEAVLIETADPLIDETIQFFRDKLDDLRKPGRISSRGMNVERNIFTDTKTVMVESNKDAILGALSYCQAAIKGLEALKLSPEFHIEGIQELKDALPSIDVYTEVSSGKKPLPGSKGFNPLHLLKSDSQLDWEMGKLDEKFKKLMRK